MKGKLLSEGWCVPVVGCITDLNVAAPSVCLVASSEAKKAVKEMKGVKAFAILSSANFDKRGAALHVWIEDPSGWCVVRRRFIFQVGVGEVAYMDGYSEWARL